MEMAVFHIIAAVFYILLIACVLRMFKHTPKD